MSRAVVETIYQNIPLNGQVVPIVFQERVRMLILQTDVNVRIGPQTAVGAGKGVLLKSGSTLGIGAADLGVDTDFNLWAVVDSPVSGSTDSGRMTGVKTVVI